VFVFWYNKCFLQNQSLFILSDDHQIYLQLSYRRAGATKNLEESADKSTEASGADENGDETTGLPFLFVII
jgi:hypothetical protein